MPYESFAEVAEEGRDALQALLRDGDGPERVWAAWALALRLGGDSIPALSRETQPDPGVRRHLVVVLAGLGEGAAVRELASSDPDPDVRATACEYVLHTTPQSGRRESLYFLEGIASNDPSPRPTVRILQKIPGSWPRIGEATLGRVAAHRAREVRHAAIEYVLRHPEYPALRTEIVELRLGVESDSALLLALSELTDAGDALSVAGAAVRVRESAPALLQVLVDRGVRLEWDDLRDLAQTGVPEVHLGCLRLCAEWVDPEALGWLGEVGAMGEYRRPDGAFATSEGEVRRRSAHYDAKSLAQDRVLDLINDPSFTTVGPLAPTLRDMLKRAEDEMEWYRNEDLEYLIEEGVDVAQEVEELRKRMDMLGRALASG